MKSYRQYKENRIGAAALPQVGDELVLSNGHQFVGFKISRVAEHVVHIRLGEGAFAIIPKEHLEYQRAKSWVFWTQLTG